MVHNFIIPTYSHTLYPVGSNCFGVIKQGFFSDSIFKRTFLKLLVLNACTALSKLKNIMR